MTANPTPHAGAPDLGDGALAAALVALAAGRDLGESLVTDAFGELMSGRASAVQAAALLMGLRTKGETGVELAGTVRALRAVMTTVLLPDGPAVIDTCGTGGGSVSTFNISTAAALVAVGAGARVAKHGNRSYTSRCGSADVLEALGIDIALDASGAAHLIERAGMAFLFAPAFHPAMRFVAPVRRELGVATVMNLAGPLANPAAVTRQVVGVADADRAPVVAAAFARLEPLHALVVHAQVGMDEISPAGSTDVWEVRGDAVERWTLEPATFGLEAAPLDELAGGTPGENAERIGRILEEPGRHRVGRAVLALNGAAAVYVAGLAESFAEGVELAVASLDEGKAAAALETLMREAAATGTSE
ncbi:MAG: anthranilate phosphoribosyltransferase [Gemmatimonadetes bacterium]|nr:anthranilate phosphoribosyltransferase [Gemmatimonadota bacterium]